MSVTYNAVGSDKTLLDITEMATREGYPSPSGQYEFKVQDDGNLVLYKDGAAVWNTGASYSKVPMLKSMTGTFTTSINGNADIGLPISKNIVLAVYCTSNTNSVITPIRGGDNWWISCVTGQASREPIANASVSVKVWYYEIA